MEEVTGGKLLDDGTIMITANKPLKVRIITIKIFDIGKLLLVILSTSLPILSALVAIRFIRRGIKVKTIREEEAETMVRMRVEAEKLRERLSEIERKLDEYYSYLRKLHEMLLRGEISREEYDALASECNREIEKLLKERARILLQLREEYGTEGT